MTKYKCWNCHKTSGIWLHILDAIKRNEKPWNKKNPLKGWHYLRVVAQDLLYINPERYIPPCATDNRCVICPDCFALIKYERTQIEAERQKRSDEAMKIWKDEEPIRKQKEKQALSDWINTPSAQEFLCEGPRQHREESAAFKWLKDHKGQTAKVTFEDCDPDKLRSYNEKASLTCERFIHMIQKNWIVIIPAPIISEVGKLRLHYPGIGVCLSCNGDYSEIYPPHGFVRCQVIDGALIYKQGYKNIYGRGDDGLQTQFAIPVNEKEVDWWMSKTFEVPGTGF